MAETHRHRISGVEVYGERLSVGDTLRASDVYQSSSGSWVPCGEILGGVKIRHQTMVYVRPSAALVEESA